MSTDVPFPAPVIRPAPRLKLAVNDLAIAAKEWRRWWILAWTDVKQRYRRSRIGQFWLTVSMAATILGIGTVFSLIMRQSIDSYFPYLGVGLIVWALISTTINELPLAFITSDVYLKSYPGPRAIVIFRTILRNVIIAGHNFVLVPVLWIVFGIPINWATLLFFVGLVIFAVNMVWVALLVGTLSARFRDVPQVVTNVVQLAFFLTPILFRPEQIRDRLTVLTHYNPFANLLEVLRAPLLGQVPEGHHYVMIGIITVVGYAIAIPFYARFRERVVYWL
ncbi:MAG: transporter permease [Microvirga sp.]|jgi:ABC-type polysaccharide/polyol phosphate export permease|nr:transporter permease [Microvirga sp.]